MADLGVARFVDRIDTAPRFSADDAAHLNTRYAAADTAGLLDAVLNGGVAGQVALVSSFGAESAVLLHLIASVDRHVPVLFLDTGKHFPETLAYRDLLTQRLGLNLVVLTPDAEELAKHPLRVGLSTVVNVDLHDQSGPVLAQQPPQKASFATQVYDRQLVEADTLIARLIHDNSAASGKTAQR